MAVARGVDKWKMKQWFSIKAPKIFNEAVVGEMPANDEKAAMGRSIVVSLDTLTKNPSHAYTNVVLKVIEVKGDSALTRLVKVELLASYIRSFVRRYRSVSDSVIKVVSKDGVPAVAKVIVVTRSRTPHTKIVGVRQEATAFTREFFKEQEIDAAISAVIDGKFQAELSNKLKHITDLNKVEVKKLEIGAT